MNIDVALVPRVAATWPPTLCVVVDELRASSTVTDALDLGCSELIVTGSLREARSVARERGALLAGERAGVTPPGFDANNSPYELRGLGLRGRRLVLCTSNGTVVLSRLRRMPMVLMGCLLNARACAEAAFEEAEARGIGIGIVCAGTQGGFALDDAVAAGVIVCRILETAQSRGRRCRLSDAARAALRLRSAYPDELTALRESVSGELVVSIGAEADVEICAAVDVSSTVPVLGRIEPLTMERLGSPSRSTAMGSSSGGSS